MRSGCHVEGIRQGPPMPLWGGERVIPALFVDICMLYLIQNNIYMFDVNGGNGGELACCW